VKHISGANCAEITRGRPGQPAYEIFNIERSFHLFKFRPSAFKLFSAKGHQT